MTSCFSQRTCILLASLLISTLAAGNAFAANSSTKLSPDQSIESLEHGNHSSASTNSHAAESATHAQNHSADTEAHASIELIAPEKLAELDQARHREIQPVDVTLAYNADETRWLTGLALGLAVIGGLGFAGWKFAPNFRISTRLHAGFGVIVILTTATGFGGMYFLNQVDHATHLEIAALDLDIKANEANALQYQFVLVGIADQQQGEQLLEEHKHVTDELLAGLDKLRSFGLDQAQAEAANKIQHETEKYAETFHHLVERYHEIEEIKEEFETLAIQVDHQLAGMLHKHESELHHLETTGAPMSEIILQTRLVEQLAKAEILAVKFAYTIAEFMLDKRIDRVATLQHELGSLKAVLADVREMIPQAATNKDDELAELAILDLLNEEIHEYQIQTTRVVEDELLIASDLIDCTQELKIVEATCIALAHQAESQVAAIKSRATAASLLIIALATTIGFAVAFFTSRGIITPINNLVDRLKDIAQGEGDLTQRVDQDRKDELGRLGRWFNTFVEKIHDVIVDIGTSAHEVASAATEIAASSEQMSQGMNEQNQQMTQISAAIEQMSASVVEVARKSTDAANSAAESGGTAQEGGMVVEQTIKGMNAISDAVSSGAQSVAELGKRGEQIGQIIEVINDIADQTNLLALNAAIEAARAGEHGRGFAVVADEVRKLADRTTNATDEIGQSIKAIQTETGQAVEKMNFGTEQVATGVESATEAGQSLNNIVASANDVASMIQSIAAAAEEQSAAGEQVSKNVEAVFAVSRQSGEGANQAAASASQLSNQAEELHALVGQFKTAKAA